MNYKLSPYATAQLLVINADLYAEEKSKEISRYRFSRESLRTISGWGRLSESFMQELAGDLRKLGWIFFELSDTECAVIQESKISVWAKLTSKRLNEAGLLNEWDEDTINRAYKRRFADRNEIFMEE